MVLVLLIRLFSVDDVEIDVRTVRKRSRFLLFVKIQKMSGRHITTTAFQFEFQHFKKDKIQPKPRRSTATTTKLDLSKSDAHDYRRTSSTERKSVRTTK
jgi:hypothetical protein